MKKSFLILIVLLAKVALAQEYSPTQNSTDPVIISYINEISPDSIKKNLIYLQDFKTRFMLAPNRKQVSEGIKNKFISLGYANTSIDSFQTITHFHYNAFNWDTTTWQYNVISVLTGSQFPDSSIIIGGHYDSFNQYTDPMTSAPGADDDGSAIAAEIEIARVFKKMNYEPKKTIKFIAFAAEELVFYSSISGSRYYALQAKNSHEKIEFYLNNDMIANNTSEGDNRVVNIYTYPNSQKAINLAFSSCKDYSTLKSNYVAGISGVDSYSFYCYGFNTVYFEEYEFSPNYHSVNDIVDNCDFNYCAEIAKICTSMIMRGINNLTSVNDGSYFSETINVYPNPTTQYLTIDVPKVDNNSTLTIYNINRQEILRQRIENNTTRIDIGNFNKGIYLLKYQNINSTKVLKILKE